MQLRNSDKFEKSIFSLENFPERINFEYKKLSYID